MNILVTGGMGYLGSKLVPHLLGAGHQVIVLDRVIHPSTYLLCRDNVNFGFLHQDIRDEIQDISRVDIVIHLAGLRLPDCDIDVDVAEDINVGGTQNILRWAKRNDVKRFIYASTCSVYGVTPDGVEAGENYPVDFTTTYAMTKHEPEKEVIESGIGCVVRMATICGLSPNMRIDTLLNACALSVGKSEKYTIWGSQERRPFLHIQDAVNFYSDWMCHSNEMTWEHTRGKIFNLASNNNRKCEMYPKEYSYYIQFSDSSMDKRDYAVDFYKVYDLLGFFPMYNAKTAFMQVVNAAKDGVI